MLNINYTLKIHQNSKLSQFDPIISLECVKYYKCRLIPFEAQGKGKKSYNMLEWFEWLYHKMAWICSSGFKFRGMTNQVTYVLSSVDSEGPEQMLKAYSRPMHEVFCGFS